MLRVLAGLLAAAFVPQVALAVQCLDSSGSAVDWWVMFKFPNGYDAASVTSSSTATLVKNTDLSSSRNPLQQYVSRVQYSVRLVLFGRLRSSPVQGASCFGILRRDSVQMGEHQCESPRV